MAFSKARITRFNEIEGCAPPPGSYNPKFDMKLVGGVLSKTQRFVDIPDDQRGAHNLSVCSTKSSGDDITKTSTTPMKSGLRRTQSFGKHKKLCSLQDLSKVGQASELQRLEDEVVQLRRELEAVKAFRSRLSNWMCVIEMVAQGEDQAKLQEVVREWAGLKDIQILNDEMPHLHAELDAKNKQLAEAEVAVEKLRDDLGNALTNLSLVQNLADSSEQAYIKLESEMSEKVDNYDRIISQLQMHLKVCDEDKVALQHKVTSHESFNHNLQLEMKDTESQLSESEHAKVALQNQLLQKCDLMEELLQNQSKLQNSLQESRNKLSDANKTIAEVCERSQTYEQEMEHKYVTIQHAFESANQLIKELKLQLVDVEQLKADVEQSKDELIVALQIEKNKSLALREELENVQEVLRAKDDELNVMSMSLVNEEQLKNHILIDSKNLAVKHSLLESAHTEQVDKILQLEDQLRKAKENIGVLQVNIASVDSNVDILKEKLRECENANQNFVALLTETEGNVTSLQMELSLANVENSDLKEKLKEGNVTIIELNEQLKHAIMLRDALQNELDVKQVEITELTNAYQEKEQNCKSLLHENEELNKMKDVMAEELQKNLVDHYDDLAAVQQELQNANAQLHESMQSEQKLQHEVKSLQDKLLEQGQQLSESEKRGKELYSAFLQLSRSFKEMELSTKECQRRNEMLTSDVQDCKTQVLTFKQKYEANEKARTKLQRKLNGTKAVHKSTQEKLVTADETILCLENSLKEYEQKEENLKKSSIVSDEKILNLQNEVKKYRKAFEEKVNENEQLVVSLGRANDEVNSVHEVLNVIQLKVNELMEKGDAAVEELLKLHKLKAENEALVKDLEKKLSVATRDTSIVQQELMHAKEHLQEHMSQANKNISTLQEQLNLALQETFRLQNDLSNETAKNHDIQDKLIKLEEQNSILEQNLNTASELVDYLYNVSDTVVAQVDEMNQDCKEVVSGMQNKLELLVQENNELQERYEEVNVKNYDLEVEILSILEDKIYVEDEVHELRSKISAAQDELFDVKQEMEDLKTNLSSLKKIFLGMQDEKKILEEEYAKAEKEWDQREQELQLGWKLLSDELKMAEEKQIELESKVIELQNKEDEATSKVKILQDDCEWAEKRQLELEESLNNLLGEKEAASEELMIAKLKLETYLNNETEAQERLEACKKEVSSVVEMLSNLRDELGVLKQDFFAQDNEITLLEDLLSEKENEIKSLKEMLAARDQEANKLSEQLEKTQRELTSLQKETESHTKMVDEMEELLQRKLDDLAQTRDHLSKLETHAQDLNLKVQVLQEAEECAQGEKKAAEIQAHQASKALAAAKEEFSQRWSTMEDSVLNLESVEAQNRELIAMDASLRSQLCILDKESTRLRTGNCELRSRLSQLEGQQARSSGHQNLAQKISYMQHLKEIITKHQQTEEELHEKLVSSDCRVAQLEAELQKRGGNFSVLGKSMMQHTTSSIAKKTPKARGKENDRSVMSTFNLTRNTSMLATSTPLQPKVFPR